MAENCKIDFVVTWVDGSDQDWLNKKAQYTGKFVSATDTQARYRDWDTLKYWFRGVEKFAPWVNNIYFVTDGQKPQWLNTDHPKLRWVSHSDFIPSEYLPTFNSNAIELNFHRIEGLSENFVYFCDDVFLVAPTTQEDFFEDNLPKDHTVFEPLIPQGEFQYITFNNIQLLNRHFTACDSIKQHTSKWLSHQSPSDMLKLFLYGRKPYIYGMRDYHIHRPLKKSTYELLWEKEYEVLNKTSSNKLRQKDDVSVVALRNWQMLSGEFSPSRPIGRLYHTETLFNSNDAIDSITSGKYKVVCINDTDNETDFEKHRQMVVDAFEQILPDKSQFEL